MFHRLDGVVLVVFTFKPFFFPKGISATPNVPSDPSFQGGTQFLNPGCDIFDPKHNREIVKAGTKKTNIAGKGRRKRRKT